MSRVGGGGESQAVWQKVAQGRDDQKVAQGRDDQKVAQKPT